MPDRDAMEDDYASELEQLWTRFVEEVRTQALNAMETGALVAAGSRQRDPFAYTNVLNSWYGAVRELSARRGDIMTEDITTILMNSDLPFDVYGETRDLLAQAREEDWGDWHTKRALSRLLIPKKHRSLKADTPEHRDWTARIRGIARTAATRNYNLLEQDYIVMQGMTRKRWVTAGDERVRPSHAAANGEVRKINEQFLVGGYLMAVPGDPAAPWSETVNCRCSIVGVE